MTDRPATELPEIEITPEMIEAGGRAAVEMRCVDEPEAVAFAIFVAMCRASRKDRESRNRDS